MATGNGRRPGVVGGLVCADPTVVVWEDGERESWLARAAALDHGRERDDWGLAATSANRLSDLEPQQISWLIAKGPDGPARALIAKPSLLRHRQRIDLGRVAVARFELDALTFALDEAGEAADQLGLVVLPFRGPAVATLVVGWLRHLGSARLWARLWLERHPEAAARALVPAAVGKPGRARQNAEDALRHLTAAGHGSIISKSAAGYGPAAHAAIEALFEPAPAARKVKIPEWAQPNRLPAIRLADRGTRPNDDTGADPGPEVESGGGPGPEDHGDPGPGVGDDRGMMPEGDVVRLVEALSRSGLADPPEPAPGDPAPASDGLPLVVESSAAAQPLVRAADPEAAELIASCEPRSLAAFGRALLDEWLTANMPAAESWVVPAQAHVGDDATMDMLAPLVRSWPPQGRYARALDGYAAMTAVGSDVALRHLLAIEENMSGGPTNERAVFYLTQAAARRGLSVTQLTDRLTITHGLDAGLTVDYGTRTFAVVTDEHLTPHVVNADGRMLARPPKPGVRDSTPEAYHQFLQLKKDLRVTATAQIARLERDMLARRLRPARDLPEVLLPHPVLGPIARRLLWGEYDGAKRLVRALRIAEDGSFADVHDSTAIVDGDTMLGIVHPAQLEKDLSDWAQLFADYEIVQPFPQVNRPVVILSEQERAAVSLPGFGPIAADRIVALIGRWESNVYTPTSHVHTRVARDLADGLTLLVEVAPGVTTSAHHPAVEQRITEIWVDHSRSDHWQLARRTPLGVCDPAALSESLVEVHALKG